MQPPCGEKTDLIRTSRWKQYNNTLSAIPIKCRNAYWSNLAPWESYSPQILADESSNSGAVLDWYPFDEAQLRQPRKILEVEIMEAPSVLFKFVRNVDS